MALYRLMQDTQNSDPEFEKRREEIRVHLEELEREFKAGDRSWGIQERWKRIQAEIPDLAAYLPDKARVKAHLINTAKAGYEGGKTGFMVGGPKTAALATALGAALGLGGVKAETISRTRGHTIDTLTKAATAVFDWGRKKISGADPSPHDANDGKNNPSDGPV